MPSSWLWKKRDLAPEDIHYVNLHGTSTEMNDRMETQALKLALETVPGSTPMSSLEVADWSRARRVWAAGIAATLVAMQEVNPTDHQSGPARSAMRSGLRPGGRPPRRDRTRGLQLRGFRVKNSALVLRKVA